MIKAFDDSSTIKLFTRFLVLKKQLAHFAGPLYQLCYGIQLTTSTSDRLKPQTIEARNIFQSEEARSSEVNLSEVNLSELDPSEGNEAPADEGQSVPHEEELLSEVHQLRQEVERLKRLNQDLYLSLTTTAEHGDFIEAQLQQMNEQLQSEVEERRRAQATLKALLEVISKRKDDLEIVVQTIMEHGDVMDTQWSQKLSEISKIASLDALTQIANRRRFDEHLEYQWKQMARERSPLALILCDIDRFKQFNDAYGHLAGDDCLQKVAIALNHCVNRPSDLVARFGGEEFAAILPYTNIEGAVRVAQRMQEAIARLQIPHVASLVDPHVTLSIGVSGLTPNLEMPSEELIHLADRHLYLAKQQGRNQIVASSALP
ncbi:MAG: diguanylate cyclase [Leptolyngbyaceae cyanobacterium bins.349]|nr:diguanylate cyclase [Leptolyngbyaceae cyanobacterium bins.349]